jgi:hypothetical protein
MDAAKKQKPPAELPADGCELLFGMQMIANWMGVSRGQAKVLVDTGLVPTFRPPGRTTRCALKAELNRTFQEWGKRR